MRFYSAQRILNVGTEQIGGQPASGMKIFSLWGIYFWRFMVLAFGFGFLLGALLPLGIKWLDMVVSASFGYSKYLGNAALIPASYLAFLSVMRRQRKLRGRAVAFSL